jgi:nitroreductase
MSDHFSPVPPTSGGDQPLGPAFSQARAEALEDAADRARLAPSVHNTQPWIIALRGDRLTLRADHGRQLTSLDPTGRALVLSVGAALFNVRAALARQGWAVEVARLSQPDDPNLLAEVFAVPGRPDSELALLDDVIARRRTNRRSFDADPVPDDVLDRLRERAEREDTDLVVVRTEEDRGLAARMTQEADRLQNSDPAYRAELRRWTTRPPSARDGVPARAVPHSGGTEPDELPLRNFDTTGAGELPAETQSDSRQTLVLLATRDDTPLAWLRAGEAFERLLLELTWLGWAASPVTQALEVPRTREQLRSELAGDAYPQMMLRIGRAAPTPAAPRRRRDDVVRDSRRPSEPLYVRQHPTPPAEPAAGHRGPVSDGRGGTVDDEG